MYKRRIYTAVLIIVQLDYDLLAYLVGTYQDLQVWPRGIVGMGLQWM